MAHARLRDSITARHLTADQIALEAGVDPKTVQRWLAGRVPHARHRAVIAKLLQEREDYLWPPQPTEQTGITHTAEILAAYGHRADVPANAWRQLFARAQQQIDLLGYALHFLPELLPDLPPLLLEKAAQGSQIRIAIGDPDSPRILERDEEEQLGGTLPARIRATLHHFRDLWSAPGIEIRYHNAPLYNSVFRCDNEMYVTPHLFSVHGSRAPLLHLRYLGPHGLFADFAAHFEAIWATTTSADVVTRQQVRAGTRAEIC